MRRRELITLLSGAVVAWPLVARAQRAVKRPIIGFFSPNTRLVALPWTTAFVQRLRELGWIEDRTVTITYRYGEGSTEHIAEFVAEFVRLQVDVIVTHGEANIAAAMKATSVIPIIFAIAADPIGSGLIASLARPGGNIAGLSLQASELAGKRLELLREVVPGLRRLAIMVDMDSRAAVLETREVQAMAGPLGLEVIPLEIKRAEDIAPAFEALKGRAADALYVCAVPLVNTNRVRINTLALVARLPSMNGFREPVEAGALMSYGPNFPEIHRAAAILPAF